eukprot:Partr_v1_DN27909_c2_g1_i2_m11004 putative Vacuolar Protein
MYGVEDHIRTIRKRSKQVLFNLSFVPRRSILCERALEEEGVLGDITIGEYHMDIVPLDSDVFSFEMESVFHDLYSEGDITMLCPIADAIMRLQSLHGIIPNIYGKGRYSKVVADLMLRLRKESAEDNVVVSEISNIILLDRTVDLVSPLLTQLTYEGLIDEIFGIQNSFVELEPFISGFKEKRKIALNSSDKLYESLRDMSFSAIGETLNATAKRLKQGYDARHAAQSVTELRDFIGKLGGLQQEHQALQLHINLRDNITKSHLNEAFHAFLEIQQNLVAGIDSTIALDYAENLIYENAPISQVLRCLCLASLINGGLKQKQYDFFRTEITHAYGHQHLLSFGALARTGFLKTTSSSSKSQYSLLRKQLRLKVDDVDEKTPNDIAYVHAIIAPLSVRLVECILDNQASVLASKTVGSVWKSIEESMKALPGPTIEVQQDVADAMKGSASKRSKTIVVFLGGCTFAEISALRLLSARSEIPRDIVILTTKVTNGKCMLENLIKASAEKVDLMQDISNASSSTATAR